MKPGKVESAGSREILLACRVCLATGVDLFSIHEHGLEKQFLEILGTVVSPSDGLPQHVCVWCQRLGRKFQEFWARSRRSHQLLETLKTQNTITTDAISGIDRVSHKLALRLASQTNSTIIEYQHQDPIKYEVEITPCDEPHEGDEVTVKCEDLDNIDAEDIDYNEGKKRSKRKKKVQKEVKKAEKPNASVTRPMEAVCVKPEPQWDGEDPNEQELDFVVVKEELELEPVLQPPDAVYALQGPARLWDTIIPNTGEKPFKCNYCSSMFAQKCNLLRHLRTHTGEKPFNCNHCSSVFSDPSALQRHLRTHTGEKPFKCNHCSSTFALKSSLLSHVRTHTGEKPFKCNYCGSMFARKSILQAHLKTHTEEKPFKCNQCTSTFKHRFSLLTHLRTHTGEKPFKCNVCGSMFARKPYLLSHLRTHTGEKPFKCDYCSSMFAQKSYLRSHLRSHMGEKPFQCNQCSSTFTQRSHLLTHLRTHSGEKPFECNHCSSTFRHNCSLVRHLKSCSSAAGTSGDAQGEAPLY